MEDTKKQNGNGKAFLHGNGNGFRNSILVAVASAIVGGTGGPVLLLKLNPSALRPDPYTGTQGLVLETRIEALEYHTRNHPDAAGQFDRRITTLEANQNIILANQIRILEKLDDH